jgi:hypothetical protein
MSATRALYLSLLVAGANAVALQSPAFPEGSFFSDLVGPRGAFSSSLGSRGPLDPLGPDARCSVEYDDVWEEKCETVFEDKCSVEYK